MKPPGVLLVLLALACAVCAARADVVRIAGSPVLAPPVTEAARILHDERQIDFRISTEGGSGAGIAALGERQVQVAMSTRRLTGDDVGRAPEVRFNEIHIGEHAVVLAVSRDVWESGVRALSRGQARDIYEGRIKNWKELGGEDQKIVFYNRAEGGGVWELFAEWVYGEARKAPGVGFETVAGDQEARDAVEFTRGSISQVSPLTVDGKEMFALGAKGDDEKIVEPTLANIASHAWPMTHPLLLVVDDLPTRGIKVLVDFMRSARGEELLKKHGLIALGLLKGKAEGGK
jgi:phosphate transport system substrate-binding protein